MKLSVRFFILVLSAFLTSCAEKVTIVSLVEEMTSKESLSYFPENEFMHKQFSSYNRASVSPAKDGWFANADMSHFLRVEENRGRREFVLADVDGPGAIVRWWMTFYKAQNGILRVYIDNDTVPVLEGLPDDLLSGPVVTGPPLAVSVQEGAPLGEEGRDYDHNFYVPLPFSRHCKITYECDSMVLKYDYEGIKVENGYYWPDVFYNIGCRIYSPGTKVESVTKKSLEAARPILDAAGKKLTDIKVNSVTEKQFDKNILPGDSLVIEFKDRGYAINYISTCFETSDLKQALRSLVLKISFDGQNTVWMPAGEFYGTGYLIKPHRTFMNAVHENGVMESFRIMPFRENCFITFVNFGKENVRVLGSAGLSKYKWKVNSMYFGASWHEYYNILSRDEKGQPYDLNYVAITGKGVYAGDQVTLFNNTHEWWGEGDEKIFVDGEMFPSSFGTGSEDYYGYSFAREEAFSHPFISQPEGRGNMHKGVTMNLRYRSLDAIPFNKSIKSDIELWHWANVRINYSLSSFFYVMMPYKINVGADVESVRKPVVLSENDFILD